MSFVSPLFVTISICSVVTPFLSRLCLVGKLSALRKPPRSCFCTFDSNADVLSAQHLQLPLTRVCFPNRPKGKMCSSCRPSSGLGSVRQYMHCPISILVIVLGVLASF